MARTHLFLTRQHQWDLHQQKYQTTETTQEFVQLIKQPDVFDQYLQYARKIYHAVLIDEQIFLQHSQYTINQYAKIL